MSVQIRIGYETDQELNEVVRRLQAPGVKVRTAEQKGQYKRAYIKIPSASVDKSETFRYNDGEQTFA